MPNYIQTNDQCTQNIGTNVIRNYIRFFASLVSAFDRSIILLLVYL